MKYSALLLILLCGCSASTNATWIVEAKTHVPEYTATKETQYQTVIETHQERYYLTLRDRPFDTIIKPYRQYIDVNKEIYDEIKIGDEYGLPANPSP